MGTKKERVTAVVGLLVFVVLATFIAIVWNTKISGYLKEPEIIRMWIEDKGFFAQIIFILITVIQVIIAVIPGEPLELAAGYAFGAIEGTILCIIATTLGGFIVFMLVRKFGLKFIRLFFSDEKINSLKFLKTSSKRVLIYFIIYMIPGTPKDLLCYFAGLTDMKLSLWIIISTIARIPSILSSTVGGNLLGTKNYFEAIIVFLITLILCIIGIAGYYKITEKNKRGVKDDN